MRQSRFKFFEKKSTKIILIAVAVVVVFLIYFISHSDKTKFKTELMGDATLPVVYMEDNGEYLNKLYGYTTTMDSQFMRGTISVVDKEYGISFKVSQTPLKINGISYQLRSLNAEGFVDENKVSDYSQKDGETFGTITFDNVMEDNLEYNLILTLDTDDGPVNYYTRVVKTDSTTIDAQLDFIRSFHETTFKSKDDAADLFKYLETDLGDIDKNNLGHVNKYSHYYQVSYSDLNPVEVSEPQISIVELDGEIGCYELSFMIKTEVNKIPEYYNVKEFYRVRVDADTKKSYLLMYDRTMNQIFDSNAENIYTNSLLIGIQENLVVDHTSSPSGKYTCFTNEGRLWLLDYEKGIVNKVFSFDENTEDDFTKPSELNDEYSIKAMNVDDDGNIEYIVYGYMNKGIFEGQVGIAVARYNYGENENEIVGFIPTTQSYEMLNTLVGDLYYLNEKNILYIVLDNSLYSVDLEGLDSVLIATNLEPGNFVVSKTQRMIAWHKDGAKYATNQIIYLDMETGESHTVDAPDGKVVSAEGFLTNDFIYGIGTAGNIITEENGNATLLKETLVRMDNNGEEKGREEDASLYFTGCEEYFGRILFNRVERATLAPYKELALYDTNEEASNMNLADYYTELDETKRKQVYLVFPTGQKFLVSPIMEVCDKTKFITAETLNVSKIIGEQNKYYVYALGSIQGVYDDISPAIQAAYELEGSVVDKSGNYAWQRVQRATKVTLADSQATDLYDKYKKGELVAIHGSNVKQMLYYLGVRKPVVVVGDDFEWVITGYNPQNYLIWKPDTGVSKYMASDDGDAKFKGATFYVEI